MEPLDLVEAGVKINVGDAWIGKDYGYVTPYKMIIVLKKNPFDLGFDIKCYNWDGSESIFKCVDGFNIYRHLQSGQYSKSNNELLRELWS